MEQTFDLGVIDVSADFSTHENEEGRLIAEGGISIGNGLSFEGEFVLDRAAGTLTLTEDADFGFGTLESGTVINTQTGEIAGDVVVKAGPTEFRLENLEIRAGDNLLTAQVGSLNLGGDLVDLSGNVTLDLNNGAFSGEGTLNVAGFDIGHSDFTIDAGSGLISVNNSFALSIGDNPIAPGPSDENPFDVFKFGAGFTIDASNGIIAGNLDATVANAGFGPPVSGAFEFNAKSGVLNVSEFSVDLPEGFGLSGENITVFTKDFVDTQGQFGEAGATISKGFASGTASLGVGVPGQEVTLQSVDFTFDPGEKLIRLKSTTGAEFSGLSDLLGDVDLRLTEKEIELNLKDRTLSFQGSLGVNDFTIANTNLTLHVGDVSNGSLTTRLEGNAEIGLGDSLTLAQGSFTLANTFNTNTGALATDFSASGSAGVTVAGQSIQANFTVDDTRITGAGSLNFAGATADASFRFNAATGRVSNVQLAAGFDPNGFTDTVQYAFNQSEAAARDLISLANQASQSAQARQLFSAARTASTVGATSFGAFLSAGNQAFQSGYSGQFLSGANQAAELSSARFGQFVDLTSQSFQTGRAGTFFSNTSKAIARGDDVFNDFLGLGRDALDSSRANSFFGTLDQLKKGFVSTGSAIVGGFRSLFG